MSREWSVEMRFSTANAALDPQDEHVLEAIAEVGSALAFYAAAMSVGSEGFSIRLAAPGASASDAISSCEHAVQIALKESGLPDWPAIHVSATEWSAFEAEIDEPNVPRLVGVSEIARLFDVSRQRVSELARSSWFPQPVAKLSAGPVWIEANIRRFLEDWTRQPGRPSKTDPEIETGATPDLKQRSR